MTQKMAILFIQMMTKKPMKMDFLLLQCGIGNGKIIVLKSSSTNVPFNGIRFKGCIDLEKGKDGMTNKEKSAKVVSEIVDIFRCPICHRSMKLVDFNILICSNNHTFDYAKQAYVNMLTRPSNQHYYKNLFEARQKIIMESNLYSSLHKKVSEIIGKHLDEFHYPTIIFDAGS